jgi:predicted permease
MNVISQVLVLFGMIALGFGSAKCKIFGKESLKHFSALLLNITLPCVVLVAFQRSFSMELLGEAGISFAVSMGVYVVSFAIAAVYPYLMRIKGKERGVHRFAIVFSNVGFMGYPMVEALLGPEWLFQLSVFNLCFNLLSYSVGAWLISREVYGSPAVSWKSFVNPCSVTTIAGFLLFAFSIALPQPLMQSIKLAGGITTPLSMMIIGITLAQADIKGVIGHWQNYVTSLMRLVFIPMLALVILHLFGLYGDFLVLSVITTAMPVAAATSILASSYDVASEEASSIVFLSTVLCIVTIPAMLFVIQLFA